MGSRWNLTPPPLQRCEVLGLLTRQSRRHIWYLDCAAEIYL
jgi:hypothetical protein